MIEFLRLPEETRRTLISQVNTKTGIPVKAIEKDWWVTLVLKTLFSLPMAEHFIFKGGTSLSKGWKLIERFSEDIDIALAPEAFGKEYQEKPSISYVKRLKKEGCIYTSEVIKKAIETALSSAGVPDDLIQIEAEAVQPYLPDKDPQTIYIRYTSLYDASNYIAGEVKVEFGVRALREPFTKVNIQSIIAEESANTVYNEESFQVTAVEPRKTFMEKLLLLHEKFMTGRAERDTVDRQSRHLYDLLVLKRKGIAEQVIGDPELYAILLRHRSQYVRLKDVDYAFMQLKHLLFLPPWELLNIFRKDYEIMKEEMLYGDPPEFNELMIELRGLNIQFAGLGHSKDIRQVIDLAQQQVLKIKPDVGMVKSTVVFPTDPQFHDVTGNIEIRFEVEFINSGDRITFHRISVK